MSTRPVRLSCKGDALVEAARKAACASYAPHTRSHAGIALQLADDDIVAGRYAENAAYNPSLAPLQSALILRDLSGKRRVPIVRAVLVARGSAIAHAAQADELLGVVAPGVALETVYAR